MAVAPGAKDSVRDHMGLASAPLADIGFPMSRESLVGKLNAPNAAAPCAVEMGKV